MLFSFPPNPYHLINRGSWFLRYYLTASNGRGHGIHSPFVFEFITKVLNDDRHFYAYDTIEQIRQNVLKNDKELTITDFGAGSTVAKSNRRKVKDIARSALKPKKYGQLMFRIINYYRANTIAELGTSLGITASYLASANLMGTVYTFEGATEVAAIAKQNFNDLSLNNIHLIEGNFDDTLQRELNKIRTVDFAFVDGNHRREPTIRYFEQLLKKSAESSIFIFDDIHWSKEMEEAWKYIKQHPAVKLTIDLFFIGIIFFREEQKVPQHFTIRF